MVKRLIRKFTDAHLAQCRWDYEHTATTIRGLAAKYGMARGTLCYWIENGQWVKYVPPDQDAKTAEKQAKAFESDVETAAAMAHDEVLADGLSDNLSDNGTKKKPVRGPPSISGDRPKPPPSPPSAAPPPPDVSPQATQSDVKAKGPGASVIPFPGARPPPKVDEPTIFPKRSQVEQAELRVQLASLRGQLAIQQLNQIEKHNRILADLTHMWQVYLAPHEFVDVKGLKEDEAQDKLLKVQRAALSLLLPSEGDTLSASLKALTSSRAAMINLERTVAGVSKGGVKKPGQDDDEPLSRPALANLGSDKLRQIKTAMQILAGDQVRQNEPPRPPPPEPLDDLLTPASPDE